MGPGMMRLTVNPTSVPTGQVSLLVTNNGMFTHEVVVMPLSAGQSPGQRPVGANGEVDNPAASGKRPKPAGPVKETASRPEPWDGPPSPWHPDATNCSATSPVTTAPGCTANSTLDEPIRAGTAVTADTVSWITAHRFGAAAILLVDPDDRGSIAATATRLIAAISRTMVVDGRPCASARASGWPPIPMTDPTRTN